MNEFAIQLKKLRTAQGYTQQQLASLLHISKSAISMYESGVREPELSVIQQIADIFSVDMDTLIGTHLEETGTPVTSPFLNMKKLIARNGNQLTSEERENLIKLLSELNTQ
ncbi:helix-turn-helix domain-containing protein [[Clostridium] polysaccharolyticum]|uniref:Helix-turn-helix n=1 Tax=[Clostridium] polysaccharolyticum TaxID=29364 RepID=A0A1I0DLD3_9FIRM|nr:helix-turn-helix transcriptional regulator [[Clostridium] polysaccharolyticum]SET33315.1 Helix-turn-helix [[Clostridium] polysaccharolyticum]